MVYESTLQVSVFKPWLSPPKPPRQKPFITKSQPRCCFVVIHKQKSMHNPCTLLLKFLFHKGTATTWQTFLAIILTIFHALTKVTISDLSPVLAHGSPSRIVQTSWGVFHKNIQRYMKSIHEFPHLTNSLE